MPETFTQKCRGCGQPVPAERLRRHATFCSRSCQERSAQRTQARLNPALPVATGTAGSIAELAVAVDLMSRGYDVFRALSPHCSCDLIVLAKGGGVVRVEVRTGYRVKDGAVRGGLTAKDAGRQDVLALYCRGDRTIRYEPEIASLVAPSGPADTISARPTIASQSPSTAAH